MLYLDYNWDLSPNGIILDDELNTDTLGWAVGDYFEVVELPSGRKAFRKVDPLVKFMQQGKTNDTRIETGS
jgi:hypothetical protein